MQAIVTRIDNEGGVVLNPTRRHARRQPIREVIVIESLSSDVGLTHPQAGLGESLESTEALFNTLLQKLWARVAKEGQSPELRSTICSVEMSRRQYYLAAGAPTATPRQHTGVFHVSPEHPTLM